MPVFITFLVIYAGLNLWVGAMVRRSHNPPFKKSMMLIMLWVAPFLGALIAFGESRDRRGPGSRHLLAPHTAPAHPPLAGILAAPGPGMLAAPGLPPFDLQAHLELDHGLPLPDWTALARWSTDATASDLAVRGWLQHLRGRLDAGYRLYDAGHAYLLSCLDNTELLACAAYLARVRQHIEHAYGSAARFTPGHQILLVIDDLDTYYDYLACYPTDQQMAVVADGTHIGLGRSHLVLTRNTLTNMEPVIAREMLRQALAPLNLPTWLLEGVATKAEHGAGQAPLYRNPQALRQSHMSHWDAGSIQPFWSGTAFATEGLSAMAFDLSRVLIDNLSQDWPAFVAFVQQARREDSGQAAAQDCLGIDLGAYVATLLAQPPAPQWTPRATSWAPADASVI